MKVMLVAPDERDGLGGGQARAAHLLAASLARHEGLAFRHVVVPHQHAANGRLHAWWLRCRFHSNHAKGLVFFRPQVVHYFSPCQPSGFWEKTALALCASVAGARVLVNFRNDLRRFLAGYGPVTRWIYRRALRRFDGAICQFGAMREFLVREAGFPQERVFVVPNAVAARPLALDDTMLARRFSERRIVFIGSLQQRKGVDTLIDAVARLRDREWLRNPVAIVGEVQSQETYRGLLAQRGRLELNDMVAFDGPLFGTEKLSVLDQASVLVLPSRSEGYPNVVLEALQAGVPVVLADTGAACDIEHTFGRAVRLVGVDDPDGVANAIEALLADLHDYRMAAMAAVDRIAAFSPDSIAERFVEVYEAMAR